MKKERKENKKEVRLELKEEHFLDKEEKKLEDSSLEISPELKKNNSKQIYWILGTLLVLVIVFFASSYSFKSLTKFEYQGITFTKEKFGEIPVFHNYYFFKTIEGKLIKYNLYLRNDPRKNNVLLTGNAISLGIEFSQGNTNYISVDPGFVGCEYGSVGISNLVTFLKDNQLDVKGASTDKGQAQANNVTYATCDTHSRDVVIILKKGEETEVIHEKTNCYILQVANCEVLQAIEKFQVQSILDSRERAGLNDN